MKNDNYVSLLDGICQRYGQLPSSVIGITDDVVAFDFNAAIAIKGSELESTRMKEEQDNQGEGKKHKTGIDGIRHMRKAGGMRTNG